MDSSEMQARINALGDVVECIAVGLRKTNPEIAASVAKQLGEKLMPTKGIEKVQPEQMQENLRKVVEKNNAVILRVIAGLIKND